MTLKLILMRHAKSSWDTPAQDDFDRPLNDRGYRSAAALGDWLRAKGHVPDQILCSSARRTRETLEGLQLMDIDAQYQERLYHAAPQTLAAALTEATGQTVLIIAHNPGIAGFAARMVTRPPAHVKFFDYPTGATLVAQFKAQSWDRAAPGSGTPTDFTVPRDLIT